MMLVYISGAILAIAVAWFPSFLCRAGSAVLLIGVIQMIWQSHCALRQGFEAQTRLRTSVLFYAPFLVGTNLIWMGLPLPIDPVRKALADCAFLVFTVILLSGLYIYNHRASQIRCQT